MIKRIDNKCPHYDEHWGCAISPIKKCDTCPSAIWYYVTDDKTKPKDMEKMDYENKYKEALERAKKLQETCDSPAIVGWMEYIFHELKESEDERIRKELLEHCKNQAKPYIQTGNKCPQIQSWIDWLEKQDNNKLNTNIKSCIEMILTDADEQRFKDYNTNLAVCLAWLKRQDEEKPIDWSDYDKTMAFTLMRDVDQMTCISKEAKNERIGWLNSLDEKIY